MSAARRPAIQEEPDTGVEAVVATAIRWHECVEANLRQLAAENVLPPRPQAAASVVGTDFALHRNA